MQSYFGYPLGSSVLEIHRVMHISFVLLHIFVLDEDFIAYCSGVRGVGTLHHICLMDFKCSDFAFALFIFRLRAFRLHLCYFYFGFWPFRLRLCYLRFRFQVFILFFYFLDFRRSDFAFSVFDFGLHSDFSFAFFSFWF